MRPILSLLYLSSSTLLASSSCDKTIIVWNMSSFSLIQTLTNHHTGCVNTLALYSPQIMLSGKTVFVWNLTDYQIITRLIGYSNMTIIN